MTEKVDAQMIRGPAPKTKDELSKLIVVGNVGAIICLKLFCWTERKWAREIGVDFLHVPMSPFNPAMAWKILLAVAMIISVKRTGKTVYVHCHDGVDRTGMVVALYRMIVYSWTYEKARQEMLARGFHRYRYFLWPICLRYYKWRAT